MIQNIKLEHIISTYISAEKYQVADNTLNTINLNTWIYNKDNKFYVGVPEIAGTSPKEKTLIATNINIVKPYQDKYLIIRNYYLFTFRTDLERTTCIKGKYIDMAVENSIINSAKVGHLKKILETLYDNCDVYFEEEEINNDEEI